MADARQHALHPFAGRCDDRSGAVDPFLEGTRELVHGVGHEHRVGRFQHLARVRDDSFQPLTDCRVWPRLSIHIVQHLGRASAKLLQILQLLRRYGHEPFKLRPFSDAPELADRVRDHGVRDRRRNDLRSQYSHNHGHGPSLSPSPSSSSEHAPPGMMNVTPSLVSGVGP
jgi:hypothetical protein